MLLIQKYIAAKFLKGLCVPLKYYSTRSTVQRIKLIHSAVFIVRLISRNKYPVSATNKYLLHEILRRYNALDLRSEYLENRRNTGYIH
jgi:hypothetical protein